MAIAGPQMFGFKTPKRKMRTAITTPLKTPTTITKSIVKTPGKSSEKKSVMQTPQATRQRLRESKSIHTFCNRNKQIHLLHSQLLFLFSELVKVTAQVIDNISDAESDNSNSESSSEDEDPEENLSTRQNNQNIDISVNAEDYFLAHSASVHTSDRTLNRLKNPRLCQETVDHLLESVHDCHLKEKQKLIKEHQDLFHLWKFILRYLYKPGFFF